MKYKSYLKEANEAIERGDTMRCKICGRKVSVQVAGKGPLVCCGQNMVKG